jgi:hypothetical protein
LGTDSDEDLSIYLSIDHCSVAARSIRWLVGLSRASRSPSIHKPVWDRCTVEESSGSCFEPASDASCIGLDGLIRWTGGWASHVCGRAGASCCHQERHMGVRDGRGEEMAHTYKWSTGAVGKEGGCVPPPNAGPQLFLAKFVCMTGHVRACTCDIYKSP